ncbi:MAG: NAD-dependent epimerase/dehydratase family protein, partial [Burkholderiales bacterium]
SGEARELSDFDRIVDVNVKGTAHVLAASAANGVRRVVYVSSGSAYGGALLAAETLIEATPAEPDTLYAITKYASERLCARFRDLRGLDAVCVRLGSVFGPWERDTGVRDTLSLPFQIYRRMAADEEVILPRLEAKRDWVYGRDVASGILALIDAGTLRHTLYNLSSGVQWNGFALKFCEQLKQAFPHLRYRVAADGEAANVSFLGERDRATMSIGRLTEETGYRPRFGGGDVFSDYVAWLAANRGYYE